MNSKTKKDIFISYRKDDGGNFGARICKNLKELGYSVYFDDDEAYTDPFSNHTREVIRECKDFLLIVSRQCVDKLIRNEEVDWVRDEILTARQYGKPIIPLLMEKVYFPTDASILPESLRFLPELPGIPFVNNYANSPLTVLISKLRSAQDGTYMYKDVFNSNPHYSVCDDFLDICKAAENGDPSAMYEMGMMGYYGVTNREGTSSPCDYDQAAYWLKKVAELDVEISAHAKSTLARMYYQGIVPREAQSYEKSLEYHRAAASINNQSASYIGFFLGEGIGCNFDYQTVVDHYKYKIHHSDNMQAIDLAKFLTKYGKYQEAFNIYKGMENLTAEAQYQLGRMYKDGVLSDPPRPDYIYAGYYFREAADKKHIQAAYEYGMLCFRPSGLFQKDFVRAQEYLEKAADGGHADAQYVLGYMYRYGHIVRDYNRAIEYLEKAKDQGHIHAATELAFIFQQPECRNYEKAYECAKRAADQGAPEGELILGNLLFFGRGCESDMNSAFEMYSRSYRHGMHYASVMMDKIKRIQETRRTC